MAWRLHTPQVIRAADQLAVRMVGPRDLDAILHVEANAHPTPWSGDVFEREFGLEWSFTWVALRGNTVVAFLVFWVIHDEVHILNIAVDPDFRRQGIATAVLAHLLELAAAQKASFVTLEVRERNQAAISLYESFGFEIIGRREKYYADTGEDAFIMSCVLDDVVA